MNHRQRAYLKQTILAITLCGGLQVQAAPEDVTVTFIQLNDLHANLVGHKDLVRNTDGATSVGIRGGMARMKTVVDGIREQNPNTLLMNIGDTYHGGVEAFFSLGNAVSDPLNAMGIDIGVPGNWDYYYTPAVTRARYGRIDEDRDVVQATLPGLADPITVKRPNFPNLGANVRDITDPLANDFLPPTHLFELSGVKVGFIGFTSDIVELMQPMLAEGMDFAWGMEEHKELLIRHAQDLRDRGADVVVVMSELGIHKDVALSKALAELSADGSLSGDLIDVFFSAHTHEVTSEPVSSAGDGTPLYAPVVEAGNDGYLGRMDITMGYQGATSSGRGRNRVTEQHWSAKTMDWDLIVIDESIAEDPGMKSLVDAARVPFLDDNVDLMAVPFFRQHLTQPIDSVIGQLAPGSVLHQDAALSGVLSRKQSLASSFNHALTEMMLGVTDAEVAITPGFRMGATVPEAGYLMENGVVADGDITVEDAYRFFPMYYGLATATTTGAHLKEAIEEVLAAVYSSDTWNNQGGWNYGYAGLELSVDLAAGDQHRLLELRHAGDGSLVADNEVLSITGCRRFPIEFEGVLCGIDGFENVQVVSNPATGLPWSLVDVFTYTLQENAYAFGTARSSIDDISRTLMWPNSDFIQPLEGVGEINVPHDPNDPCGFFKLNCIQ